MEKQSDVIELRDIAKQEWVQDCQAQQHDLQTSSRLGVGILLGVLSWVGLIILWVALTGCTVSASINFDAIDGGSEPIGYGMTQDLEGED